MEHLSDEQFQTAWKSIAKAFDAEWVEQAEGAIMDGGELVLPPMKGDDDELTWNAVDDSEILSMAEMSKVTRPPIASNKPSYAQFDQEDGASQLTLHTVEPSAVFTPNLSPGGDSIDVGGTSASQSAQQVSILGSTAATSEEAAATKQVAGGDYG